MQFDLFDRAPDSPIVTTPRAPDLSLRPYQVEARAAVHKAHETHRGCVVVMATGLGKTRLIGAVAWDWKLRGQKVLILCPTIELCRQMARNMVELGLRVGVEQADNFALRPLPDVTVASVATMRGERLRTFQPDEFGLVVFDEAHKSPSKGPIAIFEHFAQAKRLGVTATPDRSDRKSLATVFDVSAYDMSLLAGIEQGWLVPLRFRTVETDWDPSKLREISGAVGDVDPETVAMELARSGCLGEAVNALTEIAGEDRAIAFLPTVASSRAFCAEVNARHPRSPNVAQWAAHVDGATPQNIRTEVFEAFRSGVTRVISNVGVLVEGWDAPHATIVAVLAPTKSRSRLAQMIGRVTRKHPGKDFATVLDFCPGRLKKGRLASPADVMEGDLIPEDVYKEMAQGGDVIEELAKAKARVKVKEQEILEAKRRREERALRKQTRTAAMSRQVTPRSTAYGTQDHDMREVLQAEAPSKPSKAVMTPEEAQRKALGLCSPKAAAQLRRCGLNPNVSAELGRYAMGVLVKNHWACPPSLRADPRFRVPA